MTFSIILPTYNAEKDVAIAVESILAQKCREYELIITDGASTDGTLKLLGNYNDERVVIRSEKDRGIYDAMNKGISLAKGDWLYFLGSDDLLADADVLNDVQSFIEDNSEVDVVYGDVIFKYSGERYRVKPSLKEVFYKTNICHQSIFYKRSVFDKIGGYNLKYTLYADWDLNIRCLMHPDLTVKHFDRVIAIYNELDGFSSKDITKDLEFMEFSPFFQVQLETEKITRTLNYRIGSRILNPVHRIKDFFSKSKKR